MKYILYSNRKITLAPLEASTFEIALMYDNILKITSDTELSIFIKDIQSTNIEHQVQSHQHIYHCHIHCSINSSPISTISLKNIEDKLTNIDLQVFHLHDIE